MLIARSMMLTRIDSNRIKRLRDKLKQDVRKELVKLGELELSKYNPKIERSQIKNFFDICGIHHIIPLSLSGTNEIDNLVLITSSLHQQIHTYISKQVQLEVGQKGRIYIPVDNHQRLVWGMNKEVLPSLPGQLNSPVTPTSFRRRFAELQASL